jgi:hypothetical protein
MFLQQPPVVIESEGCLRTGNVRFDLTIDGKTISAPVKLSTEAIECPSGSLRGERAIVTNGSVAASVAGTIALRERDLVNHAVGQDNPRAQKETGDRQGRIRDDIGGAGNLIVVIKARGRTLPR